MSSRRFPVHPAFLLAAAVTCAVGSIFLLAEPHFTPAALRLLRNPLILWAGVAAAVLSPFFGAAMCWLFATARSPFYESMVARIVPFSELSAEPPNLYSMFQLICAIELGYGVAALIVLVLRPSIFAGAFLITSLSGPGILWGARIAVRQLEKRRAGWRGILWPVVIAKTISALALYVFCIGPAYSIVGHFGGAAGIKVLDVIYSPVHWCTAQIGLNWLVDGWIQFWTPPVQPG